MVYICLPCGDEFFFVDVERDGIKQTPLPYIGKSNPSNQQRVCYPEMRQMIRRDFTPLEDICCLFVHKMTAVDIRDGYMRIPKKDVDLI